MAKNIFMTVVALVLTVVAILFSEDHIPFIDVVTLYFVINIYLNIE